MNFKSSKRIDSILVDLELLRKVRKKDIEYVFKKDFEYMKGRIMNESIRKTIKDFIPMGDFKIASL
jgi:hypothetical protein